MTPPGSPEQSDSGRVKRLVNDSQRIEVEGPAIVHTPAGQDYEIVTGIRLRFPAESHVWIKAWPPDQPEQRDIRGPLCPECDAEMHRERRLTIGGRVPWRCTNGHLAVDDAEAARLAGCGYLPVVSPQAEPPDQPSPS